MTYHIRNIEKGMLGEWSKVLEELSEFEDAIEQSAQIMALIELSDLYGAINMYTLNKFSKSFELIYSEHASEYEFDLVYMGVSVPNAEALANIIKELSVLDNTDSLLTQLTLIYIYLDGYLSDYNLSIEDLKRMSFITERAFKSGRRG